MGGGVPCASTNKTAFRKAMQEPLAPQCRQLQTHTIRADAAWTDSAMIAGDVPTDRSVIQRRCVVPLIQPPILRALLSVVEDHIRYQRPQQARTVLMVGPPSSHINLKRDGHHAETLKISFRVGETCMLNNQSQLRVLTTQQDARPPLPGGAGSAEGGGRGDRRVSTVGITAAGGVPASGRGAPRMGPGKPTHAARSVRSHRALHPAAHAILRKQSAMS